jgi:hypothetical protein
MSTATEQLLREFKRLTPQEQIEVKAALFSPHPDKHTLLEDSSVAEGLQPKKLRPYGIDKELFIDTSSLFEPLPDDVLATIYEKGIYPDPR